MEDRSYVPYAPADEVLPPGETLREALESLEMSQSQLAQRTGMSTKHINQIIQGQAALTHDTAILLERTTGVPARFWNSLEAQYRDHLARKNERDVLALHHRVVGQDAAAGATKTKEDYCDCAGPRNSAAATLTVLRRFKRGSVARSMG